MVKRNFVFLFVVLSQALLWGTISLAQSPISARIALESQEVYLGASFVMQIQVEGAESPDKPDLSMIQDFAVLEKGGQQNSRSSVTIINGRMVRDDHHGYIFSYELVPKKLGVLILPALKVTANGQTVWTDAVRIKVIKPATTDEFKLFMELSDHVVYVGQPVTLTMSWYISKNVNEFNFFVPVLEQPEFKTADLPLPADLANNKAYLEIPLGSDRALGKKTTESLNGKEYLVVRFKKILFPKQTGEIHLPQSTVAFNAVMGLQNQTRRNQFDRFFNDDFFGNSLFNQQREVVKKFVVASNESVLKVKPLPVEGRPDVFTDLVGQYSMQAEASVTEVQTGDPITLTLRVSGPDFLDNVELPPLNQFPPLSQNFKIPAEMSPGKIEGKHKVFTQTIRPLNARVKEIPAIPLPYFDSAKGSWETAWTQPIPLKVAEARTITAKDAEGVALMVQPEQKVLETQDSGIAYNYEDLSVLENQAFYPSVWLRSPVWMGLLAGMPLLYVALLGWTRWRLNNDSGQEKRQLRQAGNVFFKTLKSLSPESAEFSRDLLNALRQYLGSKLKLKAQALTISDVTQPLQDRGISEDLLNQTRQMFEQCEALRYGGSLSASNATQLMDSAKNLVQELEKKGKWS
ncbi:MAG: BatD family protein [SAR324 cluster bacterium]|nr:BatD family protein [SAR324 cluster bacterium]